MTTTNQYITLRIIETFTWALKKRDLALTKTIK